MSNSTDELDYLECEDFEFDSSVTSENSKISSKNTSNDFNNLSSDSETDGGPSSENESVIQVESKEIKLNGFSTDEIDNIVTKDTTSQNAYSSKNLEMVINESYFSKMEFSNSESSHPSSELNSGLEMKSSKTEEFQDEGIDVLELGDSVSDSLKEIPGSSTNLGFESSKQISESTTDSEGSLSSEPPPVDSGGTPSSGYNSISTTPTSLSSISPPHTLKRSKSSTFRLIDRRISTVSLTSQISIQQEPEGKLANVIGWYPAFLLKIIFELVISSAYLLVTRLPFAISTLWLSACLWIFWKSINVPLSMIKGVLTILFVPPVERYRKKRTVLISGGSTVQAIHLARNFYSAGARVVVCEVAGSFGLARFSTAVHRFYTIPNPTIDYIDSYINALKDIVMKENVTYYIPVSETSAPYFDALAKTQLEALGCECFSPDIREVSFFEDPQEFMRKIHNEGTTTPEHFLVKNKADIDKLYDDGILTQNNHFMLNAGPNSVKKRLRMELPNTKRKFRLMEPVQEQYPFLIIRDYPGNHFITCTTVKESKIAANVICNIDNTVDGLVPIDCNDIDVWLRQFFSNLSAYRNVNGHMTFIFAQDTNGSIVPLECQVGVRLPYICYTNVHPRIVWQSCQHFSRSTSGPIVTGDGKYWIHEIFLKTLAHPSIGAVRNFAGIIFGRKEALFSFWDPLPYCAFYYLQLPLNGFSSKLPKNNRIY